jgi:hypothetical protein
LYLEVSAGWASPSSRGLWGGDTLLLSTRAKGFGFLGVRRREKTHAVTHAMRQRAGNFAGSVERGAQKQVN